MLTLHRATQFHDGLTIGVHHRRRWLVLLVAIAVAKIVIGLTATAIAAADPTVQPRALLPLLVSVVVVFAVTGTVLLAESARDERVLVLGAVFLAVGSVFADPLLGRVGDNSESVRVARTVMSLQVDAFSPYLLWRFALEFPRVPNSLAQRRFIRLALGLSFAIGLVLLVANALILLVTQLGGRSSGADFLDLLSRFNNTGIYWPLVQGACLPVVPAIVWKARQASMEERRRVALLVVGLVVGLSPTILWVFLQAVSPGIARSLPLRLAGWVTYPTLLSTPFTTAYAVLVRRALDVRVVFRRAIQYALARYTAIVIAAVPAVLLAASLYQRRDESIGTLATRPSQLLLTTIAVAGIVTLRRRSQVLARIDRVFFRERYDSQRILGDVMHRCRTVEGRGELAAILRTTIDGVLHLTAVAVLFLDEESDTLLSPEGEIRAIRADSAIASIVAKSSAGLDVDLERYNPFVREMPVDEQHWIVDGGFSLLRPLRDTAGVMVGILALGEKKSELPFSSEDLRLLSGICSAAEMTLAYRNLAPRRNDERPSLAISAVAERQAMECPRCGAVQPPDHRVCVRCGDSTTECVLPQVVGGKFLIDERIGAGAMGLVYRGMDVHLGRLVAIKTLPHLSPGEAVRMRREARAMASVVHPNLATIYGAETWQGRPMLVCEFLAGGTLADRLEAGPMALRDVIDLGLALSSVLAAVHQAGVLHRDIKPSNIGFAADGTPKLLDFGIARILTVVSSSVTASANDDADLTAGDSSMTFATDSVIRGTPLYMSPEALRGAPPDASFDLWSLALVLYEAAAGCHPLVETDASTNRSRRRQGAVADIRESLPSAPPAVADMFRRALASNREERPRTAHELRAMLAALPSMRLGDGISPPENAIAPTGAESAGAASPPSR